MRSFAAILCTKHFIPWLIINSNFLTYLLFDLDGTTWPETAKFLVSNPASARYFSKWKSSLSRILSAYRLSGFWMAIFLSI